MIEGAGDYNFHIIYSEYSVRIYIVFSDNLEMF